MVCIFFLRILSSNGRIWRRCSRRIIDGYSLVVLAGLCTLESVVPLDLIALMLPPMETQLASLTESFKTSIYATFVGLLISVDALMLLSILIEGEPLLTEPAGILLNLVVDKLMPRQREPGGKHCITLVTLIKCFVLHDF